jgi:hypothetical protein
VQVIREFHDLYIASVNVEMGPYAGQSAFYFVQKWTVYPWSIPVSLSSGFEKKSMSQTPMMTDFAQSYE